MLLASVCLWVPAALLAAAFPQQQQQQQHLQQQQQQQQQDYYETVVVFPDQVDKENFMEETLNVVFPHCFPVCQITRPRPPPRCLLPPVDPHLLSSPECKEAGRRRVGPGVIMHTFRAAEGGCRPFHYKGCGATDNLVRGNHLCIFFLLKSNTFVLFFAV